ncbi:hypothetical protein BN1708_019863, partial [Verticillium longisporum]
VRQGRLYADAVPGQQLRCRVRDRGDCARIAA